MKKKSTGKSAAQHEKRWIVTLNYIKNSGISVEEHWLEEISELHDIVEMGPHWDTIDKIVIELNPKRRTFLGTVEQSLELNGEIVNAKADLAIDLANKH